MRIRMEGEAELTDILCKECTALDLMGDEVRLHSCLDSRYRCRHEFFRYLKHSEMTIRYLAKGMAGLENQD